MPIIDLQRRQVEAGRIRAGDRVNGGHPRKLAEWRLTSKDRVRLDAAARLWGGSVRAWEGREGEFELYTEQSEIPIMLLPGATPSTYYELWSKGGCQRRCDGAHEVLSDGPCLCGDERECKPTTRLNVLLPDIPGLGVWLLTSQGWNAAAELAGSAELLGRATAQGVFIPARLRLEQRVDIKAGQTRRYAVPVIDIDVTLRDLLGQQMQYELERPRWSVEAVTGNVAATAVGWTPIEAASKSGTTVTEAIETVEQQEPHRGPRSAPPISPADDDIFQGEPVPVPTPEPEPVGLLTKAQFNYLNALLGPLRDNGHITTEQLWSAVATMRGVDLSLLVTALGGLDEQGVLHWSPLRDSLKVAEASSLIDRLKNLKENVERQAEEA